MVHTLWVQIPSSASKCRENKYMCYKWICRSRRKKKYIVKTKRSLIRVIRASESLSLIIRIQTSNTNITQVCLMHSYMAHRSILLETTVSLTVNRLLSLKPLSVTLELRPHSDPAAFLNNVKRQGKSPLTPSCVSTACSRRVHSVFTACSRRCQIHGIAVGSQGKF